MSLSDLVQIAVEQGKIPRYLYKYTPLNDKTKKIITENELWFSTPTDFNDPFDCKISSDTNISEYDLITYIKETRPNMTDFEVEKYAENLKDKIGDYIQESIDSIINKAGICCFSEINDSILMWSHYANNHTGICLKFDILSDPDFFISPLRMVYKDTYSTINFLKEPKKCVEELIKSKHIGWSYEKEIRVYKPNEGNQVIKFAKSSLVEVIFGCRSDKKEVEEFIKLIKDNEFNSTKLIFAKPSKEKYELEFKEYK
ncbi:MAG TPA: DUF2971 domain-containing protein [Paludibacter sp.]